MLMLIGVGGRRLSGWGVSEGVMVVGGVGEDVEVLLLLCGMV